MRQESSLASMTGIPHVSQRSSFMIFQRAPIMHDAVAGLRRIDSAKEEIKDTPEMPLVIVAGHAPLQVSMERHGVEGILQLVVMRAHGRAQGQWRVSAQMRTEPVRFPIGDKVTSAVLEDEVDVTLQPPAARREFQALQIIGEQ